MKTAIVIPARYGSTRFPGKPLAKIMGQTMLSRVVQIANKVKERIHDIDIFVATDDDRIADHCVEIEIPHIMTSDQCPTGSDRVLEAVQKTEQNYGTEYEFVIGLQGDAPFTPYDALIKMINYASATPDIQVVTPVVALQWSELDALRAMKEKTPFSGTTAIVAESGQALWFSKQIIPSIRKEDDLRKTTLHSPILQHIGLYGYSLKTLEKFVSLPQGHYEQNEGLEQLRFIENDIPIHTIRLDLDLGLVQAGVDSPEDIERAEAILEKYGDALE